MRIIIYGSEYGTAKQYALELSRMTGITTVSYTEACNVDAYSTIIYIGALYAGGVLGMAKTFKKIRTLGDKKIVIATVGLADPTDNINIQNIRKGIKKQLSSEAYERANIFHLRGGIDYSKLNLKHKTMMALLFQKAKSLPQEKKTAEVRAMIDTYNKQVSFVDDSSLEGVVQFINQIKEG